MFAACRLIAVSAILLFLPCAATLADTPPGHGLMAVTEDWPPYDYQEANGEVAGLNTEIVRAVLSQAGLQATFQVYPWARTLLMGQNRPNTLIFSLSRSKERENQFIWIGELMRRDDRFFRALGRRSIAPASIEAVKTCCAVCVVNRDIAEDDLKHMGFVEHKNYVATGSFHDCMKMVQTGAVPLFVDSPLALAWEMRTHNDIHTSFEPVLPLTSSQQEPLFLAASPGTDPLIARRLRTAFQTLQQSGQIDQIRKQFLERLKDSTH